LDFEQNLRQRVVTSLEKDYARNGSDNEWVINLVDDVFGRRPREIANYVLRTSRRRYCNNEADEERHRFHGSVLLSHLPAMCFAQYLAPDSKAQVSHVRGAED
jgi:hypothetical protein